jgi:hypothetical protein
MQGGTVPSVFATVKMTRRAVVKNVTIMILTFTTLARKVAHLRRDAARTLAKDLFARQHLKLRTSACHKLTWTSAQVVAVTAASAFLLEKTRATRVPVNQATVRRGRAKHATNTAGRATELNVISGALTPKTVAARASGMAGTARTTAAPRLPGPRAVRDFVWNFSKVEVQCARAGTLRSHLLTFNPNFGC